MFHKTLGLMLCLLRIIPIYRSIAGNFRGSKYSWFSNISEFVVNIFVVAAFTAGKGMIQRRLNVRGPVLNHEYFAPSKVPATMHTVHGLAVRVIQWR